MVAFYHVLHGLFLMALTVFIHAVGSVLFLWTLSKYRGFLERHEQFWVTVLIITWVVGSLVALHLLEIATWGFYYWWMALLPDFETSVYYSLVTYTTVGYGDVVLPREWRLMGTTEAVVGIMMPAWSTALLIGILNEFHGKVLEKIGEALRPTSPPSE